MKVPPSRPWEACSALGLDRTCPDPGSQMGKLRLRGRARTCWASGACCAVWVPPCSQVLTCPMSSPFPGTGSVCLQFGLLKPWRSSAARLNWSLCSAGLSLSIYEVRASGFWAPEATAVRVHFWVFALLVPAVPSSA